MQFILVVVCGAWIPITAYLLFNMVKAQRLRRAAWATALWPETVGLIYFAGIGGGDGGPEDRSHYWAYFIYSYSVLGTEYRGTFRIKNFWGDEFTARQHMAEHRVASTIAVRYNPEKPQEAVTEYDKKVGTPRLNLAVFLFLTENFILFLYLFQSR
jgi:hypothetical protein